MQNLKAPSSGGGGAQEEEARGLRDSGEDEGASSEPSDVPVQHKVRRSSRWHGLQNDLGADAGMALGAHSERPGQQCTQREDSEMQRGLARNAERGSQNEQGERVGGRRASRAAAKAHVDRKRNG